MTVTVDAPTLTITIPGVSRDAIIDEVAAWYRERANELERGELVKQAFEIRYSTDAMVRILKGRSAEVSS